MVQILTDSPLTTIVISFFTSLIVSVIIPRCLRKYDSAKLEIENAFVFQKFTNSVRVKLKVTYKDGNLVAKYVEPLLTAESNIDEKYIVCDPTEIFDTKPAGPNESIEKHGTEKDGWWKADVCKKRERKVVNDPLAWQVWDDVGKGYNPWPTSEGADKSSDGIPYRHICTITKGSSNFIDLMDVYRAYEKILPKERCERPQDYTHYVLRISGHYGLEAPPRLILKLPKVPEGQFNDIKMRVEVTGENVREKSEVSMVVGKADNDYKLCIIQEIGEVCKTLSELTEGTTPVYACINPKPG